MKLRKVLRKSYVYEGIEKELARLHVFCLKLKARWVIYRYLRNNTVCKLQIGAGPTQSVGWLTTDIIAKLRRKTIYLDATQPFPIEEDCFDYVFSEHMIEHISYPAACAMLKECFRILKPGGKIRLATPDLQRLLNLMSSPLEEGQQGYIHWIVKNFLPTGTPIEAIHVVNNQFRNYGHEFLFDETCLRQAMSQAGFIDIQRLPVGVSADPNLQGVERHGINMNNETMNAFETMVLEGHRP